MEILCFPHSHLPAWHLAAFSRLLGTLVLVSPSRSLADPDMIRLEGEGGARLLAPPEGFSDEAALARTVASNREWARSRKEPGGAVPGEVPFTRDVPTAIRDEVRHQKEEKPKLSGEDRNLAAQVFLLAARDLDASHWASWEAMLAVGRRESRMAVQLEGSDAGASPAGGAESALFEALPDHLPGYRMDQRLKSWARLYLALEDQPRILAAPAAGPVEALAEKAGQPETLFSLDFAAGFAAAPGLDDFQAGMEKILAAAGNPDADPEAIGRRAGDLAAAHLPPGQGARLAAWTFPQGPRALFASLLGHPRAVEPDPGPTVVLSLSLSPAAALALEGQG
ncbi:MAG: hypothetical protein ABIJ95_09685, partial [Pseudomonadota bacterium]